MERLHRAENVVQKPSKEQLLGGQLLDLVAQGHLITYPKKVIEGTVVRYIWNISSKPIDSSKGINITIEEDSLVQWIHQNENGEDEGVLCWGYFLSPEEDGKANELMTAWAIQQER